MEYGLNDFSKSNQIYFTSEIILKKCNLHIVHRRIDPNIKHLIKIRYMHSTSLYRVCNMLLKQRLLLNAHAKLNSFPSEDVLNNFQNCFDFRAQILPYRNK